MSVELSINERINSQVYSDVINSYVDINAITSQRNIVSGSYKETVSQCLDQTLATLNSAGGQTLFTRFKLTPEVRNATLAQLAQIYFQYLIPGSASEPSLGFLLKEWASASTDETPGTDEMVNIAANSINQHLQLKIFYDTGAALASMIQLCKVADSKISTENFNYQQQLICLNSLPDFTTQNSSSESTLKALVENPAFHGVGSGLLDFNFSAFNANTNPMGIQSRATNFALPIKTNICIEGCIDLNKGNPLFHNFPVITRNWGELYVRLYMENFLRQLNVVYLNKVKNPASLNANVKIPATTTLNLQAAGATYAQTQNYTVQTEVTLNNAATVGTAGCQQFLPYQRIPIDKSDFIYLDGKLFKIRLVNLRNNAAPAGASKFSDYANPVYNLDNIQWTRFEIRKIEFDVEDFEDIKASQGRAGQYKFPVHIFRSKNFDQTNAASSSANALQTTLNAPNIDRIFITQPLKSDYPCFLPTICATDMNPQLHNNPVLPRSEDALNSRTCERIASVFTDTDKYTPSADLYNSLHIPTRNQQIWLKGPKTYGGAGAFVNVQRNDSISNTTPTFAPNKFIYALELNEGGCFRRGYNSVIDGKYSPTVPVNIQQSVITSDPVYFAHVAGLTEDELVGGTLINWNSCVAYGDINKSGATASIHCLCDYVCWIQFDPYGNMVDFGVSEFNGAQ